MSVKTVTLPRDDLERLFNLWMGGCLAEDDPELAERIHNALEDANCIWGPEVAAKQRAAREDIARQDAK